MRQVAPTTRTAKLIFPLCANTEQNVLFDLRAYRSAWSKLFK